MPVPTYDRMMRPILALSTEREVTRRSAEEAMGEHFRLTPDEMSTRIPSGQDGLVRNRAGWAMTYLKKAGLIERVAPRAYRATAAGTAFLRTHTGDISKDDLLQIDAFREFAGRPSPAGEPADTTVQDDIQGQEHTPAEVIDAAVGTVHADVRYRLLEAVLALDPTSFERLVLDVLRMMGYGGMDSASVLHTGKSGDEGIDGRINQDPLGLDQILVQAKRYKPDNVVPRKDIQAFIGSLAGQGVTKGVFITTSSFAASAQEFVQRGSQTKVVLLDGSMLVDLMLRYKVGVRVERTIEVLDIDQNYFSED